MIPRKQLTVPWVPVRQTVLSGSVDASGFPNALSAGNGLSVSLAATTTAFTLAFATGWDKRGAIDTVGQFTSNQTWSGLTASTTCYLYIDYSVTGVLSLSFSTFPPVYATISPASPATDQHWFDLSTFTMKRWSGSAWVVFQRVFVGEAATGASTVTSVITYAYRGFYQSVWLAVVANTTYNFSHNLGINLASSNPTLQVLTSTAGNDSDAIQATPYVSVNTGLTTNPSYGWQVVYTAPVRNVFGLATENNVMRNTSNVFVTTGYYKVCLSRGW